MGIAAEYAENPEDADEEGFGCASSRLSHSHPLGECCEAVSSNAISISLRVFRVLRIFAAILIAESR